MLELKDPGLLKAQAYVDGAWRDAGSKARFPVTNPATGAVIAEVADLDADDAREAIAAGAGGGRTFPDQAGRGAPVVTPRAGGAGPPRRHPAGGVQRRDLQAGRERGPRVHPAPAGEEVQLHRLDGGRETADGAVRHH